VTGDLIANGLTVLGWRQQVVDYSAPTFPTQVWLVARADSPIRPIRPTGEIGKDIAAVKALLSGRSVLGVAGTCLDPSLYRLLQTGARVRLFKGSLNELAPAILRGEAESTILDVPDALIALEKWAGQIKVIGPVSAPQKMGVGFPKTSPRLREAFDRFLETCKLDGTYVRLVKKYYPAVFEYYPKFFEYQTAPRDLPEVRKAGVLRHLGIPYANFVTGSGDGLDVELMKRFARHLGVRYEYVQTRWGDFVADLTGTRVRVRGNDVDVLGRTCIRGDVIATGLTILPWRRKVVDYSSPTFPTQVWLIARADSSLRPIRPSGRIDQDIAATRALLKGRTVVGVPGTCLDPSLYNLAATGATVRRFAGNLNELAPKVIRGESEAAILDVPDALMALEKWPGEIKIIGPISRPQRMAVAFPRTCPALRGAFEKFLQGCWEDGTYERLVRRHYPGVFAYYPEFFRAAGKPQDASGVARAAEGGGVRDDAAF
jgi:ABC-type amino acid transport substrate-binding protein